MAALTDTSLSSIGQITPTANLLATSGDTLTYNSGANQLLVLFNTDTVSRTVTIDGAGGTTIAVPGAGATTASVAAGITYTIAAGTYCVVRLDTHSAYCAGSPVSIVADLGAKVSAMIIH